MTRRLLLVFAWAISAAAGVHLLRDTRAAARAREPLAQTLARHAPSGSDVIIVLQREDCMGNGAMVEQWNALAAAPEIRAAALVIGWRPSPAQNEVLTRTGLKIPLGSIPALDAQLVAAALGYTRTPFAVVLDRHGRVAGTFPASQNVAPEVVARLAAGS